MQSGIAGRVIAVLAGFAVLIGTGVYLLNHADADRRPDSQSVQQLAGVRLGMSPTDVTLSLGKPGISGKIERDGSAGAHLTYVYLKNKDNDYSLNITFHGASPAGLRATVVCEKNGLSGLLGLDRYSREQDVLRLLGTPSHTSIRSDGLEKAISYNSWNVSFKIALGKVVEFCIHQGNFIEYDSEVPGQAGL